MLDIRIEFPSRCESVVLGGAAHSIKDRRSSTAKAVFALDSKYKWALSGTPLQVWSESENFRRLLVSSGSYMIPLHFSGSES